MNVSSVRFGSYLTYAPWGKEDIHYKSKAVTRDLKEDRVTQTGRVFSAHIAGEIAHALPHVHFVDFFDQHVWLVPMPKSSRQVGRKEDALWVPGRVAAAMQSQGLGRSVECLIRKHPIATSHTSSAKDRPNARQHYESMAVQTTMMDSPGRIVLVDDVITRGATSMGAVNRMHEAFPDADVRVFAVMRTITDPGKFRDIVDPCVGQITLSRNGSTFRDP